MSRYRRKPVDVDAMQFDPDQKPWPNGVSIIYPSWIGQRNHPNDPPRYQFSGATIGAIHPGDWVVTNQTGECYVVLKESFAASYEKVGP